MDGTMDSAVIATLLVLLCIVVSGGTLLGVLAYLQHRRTVQQEPYVPADDPQVAERLQRYASR